MEAAVSANWAEQSCLQRNGKVKNERILRTTSWISFLNTKCLWYNLVGFQPKPKFSVKIHGMDEFTEQLNVNRSVE
jgi:hypothetical protein